MVAAICELGRQEFALEEFFDGFVARSIHSCKRHNPSSRKFAECGRSDVAADHRIYAAHVAKGHNSTKGAAIWQEHEESIMPSLAPFEIALLILCAVLY